MCGKSQIRIFHNILYKVLKNGWKPATSVPTNQFIHLLSMDYKAVGVDGFGGFFPVFESFHSVENTKFEFLNLNFPQCGKSHGKTIFPTIDNWR